MMKLGTSDWANYELQPAFVLGFHGCDAQIGEAILRGKTRHLLSSKNDYDWLGNGIYFWEGNPARAFQFAEECAQGSPGSKGSIKDPFVLGAIINLGHCLDLADSSAIAQVRDSYYKLRDMAKENNGKLPANGRSLGARRLDCLVFNSLHKFRKDDDLLPFDTIRGLFWEGARIYTGAGVREKNHIQICVCNPQCILGYFRPILQEWN